MSNDPISHEISSGDRPRRQDTTLGGADAQTRPEIALKCAVIPPLSEVNTSGCGEDNMEYHDDLMDFVPPTSYDSPLSGGNTPGSDEGRMELIQELMETCTSLTKRVVKEVVVLLIKFKELVRNLPKLKFDQHFCDPCKIGKQAHSSHKAKNLVSTTRCLELLYMNLFSPSAVRGYRGNLYTLVIVDDYSRTNHDREFDNEVQFGDFCNANSITHNFSPCTPQSNGVVERKNRTLQEMSRKMFNEQSLPQKFWCNVLDTSSYILNQILIRAILGKPPYELLRGRKPTLDYFKVFGSKCFILNTRDYLTKFNPKSYKGVFLGYFQNSKAYIILDKHTMKIEESLNAKFDETPPPSKISPLVDDD
ncbi:retrovirus-related pol polyprotein from transposon TNT 1-94 [Tanacetum coccineum]